MVKPLAKASWRILGRLRSPLKALLQGTNRASISCPIHLLTPSGAWWAAMSPAPHTLPILGPTPLGTTSPSRAAASAPAPWLFFGLREPRNCLETWRRSLFSRVRKRSKHVAWSALLIGWLGMLKLALKLTSNGYGFTLKLRSCIQHAQTFIQRIERRFS